MWKLFALLVHILMIGFTWVIYFQSTIQTGLPPQATHIDLGLKPPADRLVVFITDGFRAESFFRRNVSAMPSIQKIILNEGLAGVSRTCAPTQSRPGHIAIFGGFNEDPAAAMTNFHKNPSSFDTVFNRTSRSWGWGSRPVISIFKDLINDGRKNHFEMYTLNEEIEMFEADNWVFNKVRHFLASKDNVDMVKEQTSSVFLVYLGDIDLAGHSAKPNTKDYMKVVNNTQFGIGEIYELFENTFSDRRTVYLLTSDHGMTDSGAHGGGSQQEIELPFVLWGAGVKRDAPNAGQSFPIGEDGVQLPLHEIEQVQMASLMSALIGLPPPINNMATLPLGYLNVSAEHKAHALHLNGLQLLAQVERMQQLHQLDRITDWLPIFERLDKRRIQFYKHEFKRLVQLSCFPEAIQCTRDVIRLALECLEYYRDYYRIPLYAACIGTYLGWFYYLVAKQARKSGAPKQDWLTIPIVVLFVLELVLMVIFYLHRMPCWTSFFLLVPVPIWMMALRERGLHSKYIEAPLMQLAWIVCTAALLISSTQYWELVTLGYVIVVCANNWQAFTRLSMKFFLWIVLVGVLAVFSLIRPSMGYQNKCLLYLSMILTLVRPLILDENHAWRVWISNSMALLLGGYIVQRLLCEKTICPWLHYTMWGYLIYALVSIPYSNTKTPKARIQLILFNLSTIYTLLSLSYESIFMQVLCTEFLLGMDVHENSKKSKADSESESDGDEADKPAQAMTSDQNILSNYRYALLILCYTYFSIIGTGNQPQINSFDPDTTRVFIRQLPTLLVGSLIVLKLFIPNIIIMASMYAFCSKARHNIRGIFICLFLICDAMCLYFFFFVRNTGSWIGVRESLSNLLIVHGLPILLIILSWVPKQFLSAIPLTMLPMLRWKSDVHLSQPGQSLA